MKKKIHLTKDRPMTSISLRIPADLVEKLKKIAPLKEMSGYQSLIKYYIGQGLLNDVDLVRRVEEQEDRHLTYDDVLAALDEIQADGEKRKEFLDALHLVKGKHLHDFDASSPDNPDR